MNPDFAEAHLNLGAALRSLGREPEALASFEKAIELKPQLAKGYFSLKPMRMDRSGSGSPVAAAAQD